MPGRSAEDYLKAILKLGGDSQPVNTKSLAETLGLRMASVTGMVKQLAAKGYVEHKRYRGVRLTEEGRRHAVGLLRKHRLMELFLVKTLGCAWDEVHDDAERLEHAVSDRLIERISEFLGHPEIDPHGSPIPTKEGVLSTVNAVTLDEVEVGANAEVVNVSDEDPAFLRYLTGLNLKLGSRVHVIDRAPFDGPITLRMARRTLSIGSEAARRIRVSIVA